MNEEIKIEEPFGFDFRTNFANLYPPEFRRYYTRNLQSLGIPMVEAKRLRNITDLDAKDLCKILGFNVEYPIIQGQVIATEINDGTFNHTYNTAKFIEVIDFLRERGYAIAYKKFSVEELRRARVFI